MSSIWTSGAMQAGASPFGMTGLAPNPGGGAAAKFQSLLQAAGNSSAGRGSASAVSGGASSMATGSTEAATGSSSTSDSSTGTAATITANDFLTLLVTEMQNQDPTAQTDPNEYINQLVQINSLEQLISINQNLADVLGAATTPTSPPTAGAIPGTQAAQLGLSPAASGKGFTGSAGQSSASVAKTGMEKTAMTKAASGNLNVPHVTAASRVVAHSLDGHPRAARPGHGIRDIPTH